MKQLVVAAVLHCLLAISARADFVIRFNQQEYVVPPQQEFVAQLLIDPAPTNGLASFGLILTFDAIRAQIADINSILVPIQLNFNGVNGPGALKATGNGFGAVKGTVNFFNDPLQPYFGSLLATFRITNLGSEQYTLGAELYRTLGAAESIFVDGAGTILDQQLSFSSARVVPEPSTVGLLGLGGLAMVCWRRKVSHA
jgi:hypothetical protein